MDNLSSLEFGVLKTNSKKSNTDLMKPVKKPVPHFDGLTNPFYKAVGAQNVKSESNDMNKYVENQDILKVLKSEKIKATQKALIPKIVKKDFKSPSIHKTQPKLPQEKPFKTPMKKVCTLDSCSFCNTEKCGSCLNCRNKSRHNKCLFQMCPRLNKKWKPSEFDKVGGQINLPGDKEDKAENISNTGLSGSSGDGNKGISISNSNSEVADLVFSTKDGSYMGIQQENNNNTG